MAWEHTPTAIWLVDCASIDSRTFLGIAAVKCCQGLKTHGNADSLSNEFKLVSNSQKGKKNGTATGIRT